MKHKTSYFIKISRAREYLIACSLYYYDTCVHVAQPEYGFDFQGMHDLIKCIDKVSLSLDKMHKYTLGCNILLVTL